MFNVVESIIEVDWHITKEGSLQESSGGHGRNSSSSKVVFSNLDFMETVLFYFVLMKNITKDSSWTGCSILQKCKWT